MKNILTPLSKSVLIPLRWTAVASATDAAIFKKMFGFGRPSDLPARNTTLIISNKQMNYITKLINSLG